MDKWNILSRDLQVLEKPEEGDVELTLVLEKQGVEAGIEVLSQPPPVSLLERKADPSCILFFLPPGC